MAQTLGERALEILECAGVDEAVGVQYTLADGTTIQILSPDSPAASRTDVPVAAKVIQQSEAGKN
jgi:hypothetical protein